jgi:hypothetical protein
LFSDALDGTGKKSATDMRGDYNILYQVTSASLLRYVTWRRREECAQRRNMQEDHLNLVSSGVGYLKGGISQTKI